MPTYSYHCAKCDCYFDAQNSLDKYKEPIMHEECGELCERDFEYELTKKRIQVGNRERGVDGIWRDIALDPIHVQNRRELKDACKRHGCYAPAILD